MLNNLHEIIETGLVILACVREHLSCLFGFLSHKTPKFCRALCSFGKFLDSMFDYLLESVLTGIVTDHRASGTVGTVRLLGPGRRRREGNAPIFNHEV